MPAPLRSSSRLRVLKQGAAATDGLFIVQIEKNQADGVQKGLKKEFNQVCDFSLFLVDVNRREQYI